MVAPAGKLIQLSLKRCRRISYFYASLLIFTGFMFDLNAASAWQADLETIRAKAEKGDLYYQGLLGIHLKHGGHGAVIDLVESDRWSAKAAEGKGAFGLCNLASLEMRRRNFEKGRFLFDEAHLHSNLLRLARADDAVAIFCLGLIEMECPPRNIQKAIRHFQKSSNKGFPPAQATLGMIKLNGIGTVRDQKTGIKWLQAAAQSGSPYGDFHLGMAYSIGDGVPFDQTKSMQLIRQAAEAGLENAQFTLGMKYAEGEGVPQDYSQAVEWLRKASNQGFGEATLHLRRCETMLKHTKLTTTPPVEPVATTNDPSETIPKTPPESVKAPTPPVTPSPSAEEENRVRLQQARHLLLVERKTTQAKKMLTALALQGVTDAQKLLGIAHYRAKDYQDAHLWLLQAAQKNDPQAQRYLGMTYFLGQGVHRDYDQASKWLAKAAAQGDQEAIRYREILRKFYQEQ